MGCMHQQRVPPPGDGHKSRPASRCAQRRQACGTGMQRIARNHDTVARIELVSVRFACRQAPEPRIVFVKAYVDLRQHSVGNADIGQ